MDALNPISAKDSQAGPVQQSTLIPFHSASALQWSTHLVDIRSLPLPFVSLSGFFYHHLFSTSLCDDSGNSLSVNTLFLSSRLHASTSSFPLAIDRAIHKFE